MPKTEKRFLLTNIRVGRPNFPLAFHSKDFEFMVVPELTTPNLRCSPHMPGIWGLAIAQWVGSYLGNGWKPTEWDEKEIPLEVAAP